MWPAHDARGAGSAGDWWALLAPEPARVVRAERAISIACRTMHLAAFGLVLGGVVWGVDGQRLVPAVVATALSGTALVALELYKSLHWLFMGRGLFVLAKLTVIGWLPFAGDAAPVLLGAVVVLGSVGSHLPARYRHYSVLLRRPVRGLAKDAPLLVPARRT